MSFPIRELKSPQSNIHPLEESSFIYESSSCSFSRPVMNVLGVAGVQACRPLAELKHRSPGWKMDVTTLQISYFIDINILDKGAFTYDVSSRGGGGSKC